MFGEDKKGNCLPMKISLIRSGLCTYFFQNSYSSFETGSGPPKFEVDATFRPLFSGGILFLPFEIINISYPLFPLTFFILRE